MDTQTKLANWRRDYDIGEWTGDETPENLLAEYVNCKHAEVHENGDLYIEDPMKGHYVNPDTAAFFVEWLQDRGSIA